LIFLISASSVVQISGLSHWLLAVFISLLLIFQILKIYTCQAQENNQHKERTGGVAVMVECLPSTLEAL
jgi:uncharacterized membrane protein YjfL (UPF0719 family)